MTKEEKMENSILVSAIVTTYKRESVLVCRAVESILNQTYGNIEIIVVDDNKEEDKIKQNLKIEMLKYGEKVHYVEHEKNMGACAARNSGLKVAKGEFVAFLDDDDEWLPQKIEKQLKKFNDEKVALVYCNYTFVHDKTGTKQHTKKPCYEGNIYDSLILTNYIGSTSFPLIRKKSIDAIGGFDLLMKSAQDYDVWLRLSKQFEVKFVDESLGLYHIHEEERISTNKQNKIDGVERLNQKNMEYLNNNKKAWRIRHVSLAKKYASAGDIKTAFGLWIRICFKDMFRPIENIKFFLSIGKEYMVSII